MQKEILIANNLKQDVKSQKGQEMHDKQMNIRIYLSGKATWRGFRKGEKP